MSEVVLQDLMSICVDGPALEDFDATESINVWLMEGTGTRMVTNQRAHHQSRLSDSEPPSRPVTLTLLFEILTFRFDWGNN